MTKPTNMIGGAKGGGGSPRVAVIAPDSVRSQAIIEYVEAWGWGEIEGFPVDADPLEYVFLDGVPIKSEGVENFKGVTFECRLGTQDQSYIPGVVDDSIGSPEVVDVLVSHDTPVTRTISDPNTDAVRVIVTFDALMTVDTASGDRFGATVELKIEVKPAGGSWSLVDLQGRGKVVDKTEAPYQRSFVVDLRGLGNAASYDVKISRVSADPFPSDRSAFRWSTYTKLTYAKLRRPNIAHCRIAFDTRYFSSVPVRSYLLRGSRVQVPTSDVYDPIARTYTGADWSGTLVKSWSRNPAWFLYYLLTTAGVGLGDDINPAYQDKWVIYQIAKRCDELVPDGFGGTEPRYSIDAQFMAQTSAHDMIMQIAGIFDAQALWDGKSVYLTQDAPKPVSSLYLPANVVSGRFSYAGTSRQVRYTAALIQYNDPSDQYRLTTEYVEDRYGIERYGYRPKSETAVGCTSRGQAHRHGKRLLVTGRLETDAVTFSVGLSGINDKPGDIVRIADPLRSSGRRMGGRISSDSTTTIIQLDAPVTLYSGHSYRLAIIGNDGDVWDSAVVSAAGEHSAVTVSPGFAEAPERELEWIVYDPLESGKLYRILGITDNDDKASGFYTVTATQYAPDKFDEIDDLGELGPMSPNPYGTVVVIQPTGVQINEGIIAGLEGMSRYIDISWEASLDPLLRGYVISYRVNGGTIVQHEITSLSYRINNALMGVYEINLCAINFFGAMSAPVIISYTLLKPYAIEDVSIVNLGVKGVDDEFMGRNCELFWETDADTSLNIPITYSGGIGGSTKWMRDFEVKIFTADGVTLLRTEYVTEHAYSYTFEKNVEDGGPRRTFKAQVKARDEFGNYSIAANIVPYNTPPQADAVIETVPTEGAFAFKITPPSDPDYRYLRIFGSKIDGFTPDDTPTTGNLLFEGAQTYISFAVNKSNAGRWYFRFQFVDEFGVSGAIFSDQVSQLLVFAYADLEPTFADEIVAVITDFNASNNRSSAAIPNPSIATDGTAIDHVCNANGSIDMSFEWSWSGSDGDIDGFAIYLYASTDSAPYVFVGAHSEVVIQVPAAGRSYIHHGLAAYVNDGFDGQSPLYYTFGVIAYRKVDKDISASGLIISNMIQASGVGENPYCPAIAQAGTGDITATINGILAANVNKWAFVTGAGRPYDNADVTKDQISGSGVNVLNNRYALIEESSVPPVVLTGGTVALNNDAAQFNISVLRLTATSALAELYLAGTSTDYNFILTPNKKWLISAYVRSATANASGTLRVRASNGAYAGVDFLTSATPNTWSRVSGAIDFSGNSSALGLLRLENDAGSGVYIDFTGLMMEELIGNIIAPSAFVRPAITSVAVYSIAQLAGHISDFVSSNNRNAAAIVAPVVAADGTAIDYSLNSDGSANITFEWSWSGNEGDIDGFDILVHGDTSSSTYVFGTDTTKEFVIQLPASRRSVLWSNVVGDYYWTIAVCAYRGVDKDIAAAGAIFSSIVYANGPSERPFRAASAINYTGNVGGQSSTSVASTVTSTTDFRNSSAPTNSPAIGALTTSSSSVGTVDITVNWTYTQGALTADEFVLYAVEGTTNPTNSSAHVVATGAARSYTWHGVPADKSYKIGISARRKTASGVYETAIVNAWTRTGGAPSISAISISGGMVQGIGTGNGTMIANSAISISADGALNGAGGGQVTLGGLGAGNFATISQLNSSNIASYLAANSIGDTYLTSIAANKITAGSLAAGVVYAGTINASQINAGTLYSINVESGYGNFTGYTYNGTAGGYVSVAGLGNSIGVFGAGFGVGVYGQAIGSFAPGVKAENNYGGNGLTVIGTMSINNSTMVTNLNANYVGGYSINSIPTFVSCNSGTANVTGHGLSVVFDSTMSGSFRTWSGGDNTVWLGTVSDERLKQDIRPETLGLDFICNLEPSAYYMRNDPKLLHHGFVAQKMAKVFSKPNIDVLFTQADDGIYGINNIALIAPLVKAVQELRAEIQALKNKLGE